MWWPAIGGLVIGLGGLIEPRALGVGYDSIGALLDGDMAVKAILVLVLVKWTIWSFSLGSGTSGGVLAPLLMIGGALGALMGHALPDEGAGFWALVAMGAILGGTMRSPLTGIVFAVELTHDMNMLLPLVIAVTVAHAFTVLTLKRSILTEKVARRGFHMSREYAVDPLEILFAREVMRTDPAAMTAALAAIEGGGGVVHPDDSLRVVVYKMAETGRTCFPVVQRALDPQLVGIVALDDLLAARARNLDAEQRRERVLRVRFPFAFSPGRR
jgi:hypothetical protein